MSRSNLADMEVCLSLSNLCFLNFWVKVQDFSMDYYLKPHPRGYLFLTTLSWVLLTAFVFWLLMVAFRHVKTPWLKLGAQWAFLVFLLIPLNAVRTTTVFLPLGILTTLHLTPRGAALLGAGIAVGLVWLVARWLSSVVQGTVKVVRVACLLLPILVLRTAWCTYLADPDSTFQDQKPAAVLPQPPTAPQIGRASCRERG